MKQWICFTSTIFTILFFPATQACTDFRLVAKDGSVIITRSMEFAYDMNSNIRTMPRGNTFNTTAPDGTPTINWTNKYGYLYLDGMNIDAVIDGINENGLTIEDLLFPGFAGYQNVPPGKSKQALPYTRLGDYILGNFKTIDEVKQALTKIFVFPKTIPGQRNLIFPLHFSIFDSTGKGIIVEYVNGRLNIYDNNIGVLTNSPTYDWHLTNLRNYVNLSPLNPNPVVIQGVTFTATGQGAGMVGLPGDISPPSRFVKISVMKDTVLRTSNALNTVNLAEHLINNVDIPIGFVREAARGPATTELTQWVVFKDLTHRILYYRTYENLSLRKIDLNKI